ncbi:MAG: glycosyltransferase family 39 protein [Pseudomonadota bacterium]|nr:glycosyltransferase family 39 protein [Pseudomonadota bacterium]
MSDRLTELTTLEDLPPAEKRPLFGDDAGLMRVVIATGAVFALWKLFIAMTGNVIWEEAHFAVLGQRPDLAYPDIPAGWPLLANLCTRLFGWSAAAIRVPGLIIAETIPLAVYWLARAVVSHREALWAALIAIVVPALGMSGTIFYPEEALQIALAVMLGAIIRAMRAERTADVLKFWALAGAAGGIGLFVHFRFVLAGVGVFLFLLDWPGGRRQWLKPGLWLAAAVAMLGLLPGLIYNMREHWPALTYQVANRPSWRFMPGWGVTFLENQIGLATPAFLVAFAVAARRAWMQAREHEDGAAALLLSVAGVIFGLYAILSLFDSQVMPHWPFLAYVALAPLVPGVLIRFVDRATTIGGRQLRMGMIAVFGPVVTVLGALAGTAFEEGWAHADKVPAAYRPLLFTRLEDWTRMQAPVDQAINFAWARFPGPRPVIASAGHISALRLEFPGPRGRQVYALDEPYDDFTRFSVIRKAWGLDEAGLKRDHAGGSAVLVLPEPSYLYNTPGEMAFRRRLCGEFADIRPAGFSELPPRKVAVELYSARIAGGQATGCPLFPRFYIGQPTRGATFRHGRDSSSLFGLASDPKGVTKVEALLDGKPVSAGQYGQAPAASPAPSELADDPNYPRLWFTYTLPAAALTPGEHRLSIRATTTDGRAVTGQARSIYVR